MFKIHLFLCLVFVPGVLLSQGLSLNYGAPWGVHQLSYNNIELVNLNKHIGAPVAIEAVKLINKKGKITDQWSYVTKHDWNDEKREFTSVFNNILLACNFKQLADTLFIQITLTNTSADTLSGVSICPLTLNFGKKPDNIQPYNPYYSNNIAGPSVIIAYLDTYNLMIENPDVTKKIYTGLLEENNTNGTTYRLWTGSHPFTGMQDFDSRSEIKLAPGRVYSYSVSLKFCKKDKLLSQVASKTYSNFKKANPFLFKWPDRRPVGALFLSSYNQNKNVANPRNWVFQGSSNAPTNTEHIKELKASLMSYADKSISILKDMDAQGMITWDIEGQEFPHPLSYIGSPELIGKVAPEMNSIIDEYFAKFRNAGFKTGICIRPDSVVFKGGWIDHLFVKDPAATLIRKISYARKRWGCTLFYIDSNVEPSGNPLNPDFFKKVREKFPDVLLIPEHERTMYFAYTTPYDEMRMGTTEVNMFTKYVYPEAFMVINVAEGLNNKKKEAENLETLINSSKSGNIFLFSGWYNDQPMNGLIKKAYKIAHAK